MDLCTEVNFLQQQGGRLLEEPPHRGLRCRISLASLLIRAEGNLVLSAQSSPVWLRLSGISSFCLELLSSFGLEVASSSGLELLVVALPELNNHGAAFFCVSQ